MDSGTPENAAPAALLATISDRRIRRKVQKLLQLGEEAVRALGELDAALYLREDGEEQLQIVADAVLSHFRRLLEYLGMVAPSTGASAEAGNVELELDGPAARKSAPIAARGIIAHRERSDEDRWSALSLELVTLQYGLGSELKEFERRFSDALKNDRKEQAVRDLNDATTGLIDGVFAVMTSVYECFLGYAEPERMVPGHRDTLGKALAVRRALAELRREVRGLNQRIQDRATPPDVAETSYGSVVEAVGRFIESDVFNYLRSDSRGDFWQVRETLANGSAVRNRLDCEGFDKYLDSMAFVSQRGVLIKHDTDLKAKAAGDLERALKFAALLPEVVCEVIEQAFVKGERLSGLNDQLDALVLEWCSLTAEERADVQRAVALGRQLLELVRTAPRQTSSSDGDAF
ncbi:MAG: hypothetical protein H0T79_03270 [Deltaproteobacteria bacterium]|nr:hypothetical protein [Deltaproteobacteria bacterium]